VSDHNNEQASERASEMKMSTRPARRWLHRDVVFSGKCCSTRRSYS
jgi:hypothetical protein